MKISWEVAPEDVQAIKEFFNRNNENSIVKERIRKNINGEDRTVTKEEFWEKMVCCLLTTQQRSGPNSAISRFMRVKPFPLSYEVCKVAENLESLAKERLSSSGGIRRTNTIAKEVFNNFKWLEEEGWDIMKNAWSKLEQEDTPEEERALAKVIIDRLYGFGPKQSRNLLQQLGLTRYEIPIDSRITKWMKEFGFPIELSATGLADGNYYNLVLDGFKEMCMAADIYPCLMDGAIFTSYDEKDAWAEKEAA